MREIPDVLDGRRKQVAAVAPAGTDVQTEIECSKSSLAGSVSQRACVFCGSRVVLYPVADAVHLVHGPMGCAAYTWDIRGAVSSGPQLHRLSFSTDLREQDVIFGGEEKLYAALISLIDRYSPAAAFVYSTCIVGLIGDDVDSVCRRVSGERGIPVIPVDSAGFRGTKKDGYRAACDALLSLVGTGKPPEYRGDPSVADSPYSVNILGEFNIACETRIIRSYLERIGIRVNAVLTGDGRVGEIRAAHHARLNLVQCSGSMNYLAKSMEDRWGIPSIRVSFFGIDDTADSIYAAAGAFPEAPCIAERAADLVSDETLTTLKTIEPLRRSLEGKKAAVYVGGSFKARSLVKALRLLGISTVVVGSQTGNADDYRELASICDPGTILVDDSNPAELSRFIQAKGADILVGGVKERPIAYKLGLGFCDHNHERKIPLAGFEGMIGFAREIYRTAMSPVWNLMKRELSGSVSGGKRDE